MTQLSIADLSEEVNAGEASVIRFCRQLGYKGFQNFKMELAIELAMTDTDDNSTLLEAEIQKADDAHTIGLKLQGAISTVLSETLNLLDMEQVERVVEALHSCNSTFIFGVGASGLTAEEMKHKLMRIGMRVDALTNNHFMYMQAALLKAGDVAIGISHSGHSPETTHALSLAKQAGAVTVALTHNLGSPLSKVADITLINGNRQDACRATPLAPKRHSFSYWISFIRCWCRKTRKPPEPINCARWMPCPRSNRASFVRFITICYSRFPPCRYPVATGMVTF